MSARVFAEKNAGRRVRVFISSAGPNRRLIKYPYCQVVGYNADDEHIYVEFEDQALQQFCSNPNGTPGFVRTAPSTRPGVWAIGYEEVRFLRRVKTTKPLKPVKVYPHTCGKCHSPARKCSNYILCSNNKCSSNKKFKQVVLSKMAKIVRIKCPTCRKAAIEVGAARSKANVPEWRFSCEKRHTWTYSPKENDVVSSSARANERDRIWKTNNWQMY